MLRHSTLCMRASWCIQSCQLKSCGLTEPEPRQCSCKVIHHTRVYATLPPAHLRPCNTHYARRTTRCFRSVKVSRRLALSAHILAEQLVLTGDTPVGPGLLSCQICQSGTALLNTPLNEVLAITEPHLENKQINATLSAATAAYSAMPKKLLQFVQGASKLHERQQRGEY